MKSLNNVAFLLLGIVAFHLFSSSSAGIIKGEGSLWDPKKFCLPAPDATDAQLQKNLDWLCSVGIDCDPIKPGGACFIPSAVRFHAAFVMNSYFKTKGGVDNACDFQGTGVISSQDPSYNRCIYA